MFYYATLIFALPKRAKDTSWRFLRFIKKKSTNIYFDINVDPTKANLFHLI